MKVTLAVAGLAAPAAAATPKWEVASIKPCVPSPLRASSQGLVSPGRLHASCVTVMSLIQIAYDAIPNPLSGRNDPVSGGPPWLRSDRYDIEAKAEGNPSAKTMERPMLQDLLKERFKLHIRLVTREIPVYELTVAKSGFRLQPIREGSCTPFDDLNPAPPEQLCTASSRRSDPASPVRAEFHGRSMDEVSADLGNVLDRPVINKTGIAGRFDFHLEYGPDLSTPVWGSSPNDPTGPSILTAIQEQVGLRLVPAKGPGTSFVIESVERPSAN
jgi:uncharacterized protein (TIGR03435 family)